MADDAEGARPVVEAPAQRRRRERALDVALVAVDVRRERAGHTRARTRASPARKCSKTLENPCVAVAGEHRGAVAVAQREVDVARVALSLVELRHEGEAAALLGGDLLRAELEQAVLVGLVDELGVAEGDLVLAGVALALRGLDLHARAAHLASDPPEQRLDARRCPAGSSRRCRGWRASASGSRTSRRPRRCR